MLSNYYEQINGIILPVCLAILFLMIGLSINDVLKQGEVARFGRIMVWIVLFVGCAGFLAKGLIQFGWETLGLG